MTFVTTAVLKRVTVIEMLNRSMKEKTLKCGNWDYRHSQKMIRHAASVHERKKPSNVKFATRTVL